MQATNSDNLSDIMDLLIGILGDAQEALGIVEIVMDTTTVQSEWTQGDYFEAGLYAGKGVVNTGYTLYGIISKYITLYWQYILHLTQYLYSEVI